MLEKTMFKPMLALLICLCCLLLPLYAEEGWLTHTNQKYVYSIEYPVGWQISSDADKGTFEASYQADKASLPNRFRVDISDLSEADRNLDFMEYMQNGLTALKKQLDEQRATKYKLIQSVADTLAGAVVHRIEYRCARVGDLLERTTLYKIRHNKYLYTLTATGDDSYYFGLSSNQFAIMTESFRFIVGSSEYLDNYVRVCADLSGKETVWHWEGKAYALVPGEKRRELFNLEGYYIVRSVPVSGGYQLLGREAVLIQDYRNDQILTVWRNPMIGKDVDVVHIFNDPSNVSLSYSAENINLLPLIRPSQDLGTEVVYYSEVFPFYPNPLTRKDFPLSSQNDTFQASEVSQYNVQKLHLNNKTLKSVPASYNFTKLLPWLPFMNMGERPGNLLLTGRGRKLEGGFTALPSHLREYILQNKAEFAAAPSFFTQPNETPWTYWKKLAEQAKALESAESNQE